MRLGSIALLIPYSPVVSILSQKSVFVYLYALLVVGFGPLSMPARQQGIRYSR